MSRPPPVSGYLDRLRLAMAEGHSLNEAIRRTPVYRFFVYATEWRSGHGGLSTFNRRFCLGLVAAGHDVCVCLPEPPPDPVEGVRFVPESQSPDELARALRDFRPDFIVGHDRHTGPKALAAGTVFRGARTVLFIHTDPKIEYEKGIVAATQAIRKAEKENEQATLISRAAIVVAVGPRLWQHAHGIIAGIPQPERPSLYEFIPGFQGRAEDSQVVDEQTRPQVLFFGRAEDGDLKGLDLFIQAMQRVSKRATSTGAAHVVPEIVGAEPERARALFKQIWGADGNVEIYTADEGAVHARVRAAHLVLMPSREEGFGLVALEALEGNRPVLASRRSGFAEWLSGEEIKQATQTSSPPFDIGRFLVATPLDEQVNDPVEPWALAIEAALASYPEVTKQVAGLRSALEPLDWRMRADRFCGNLTEFINQARSS